MGSSTSAVGSSGPALDVDALAVLNAVPGVVGLISASGEVLWINDSMSELTGYTAEELVGSSMLDHLDIEWNPLALESISYALDNPGLRLPTMLRFHTARGVPVVMEATANNQLDNPLINGLVVHLRPSDERQLLDGILESFAAGESLASTIGRVHDVARAETMRSESAVVLLFPGAELDGPVVASSPIVDTLSSVSGLATPWAVAAARAEPVLMGNLDELPDALRSVAAAAGFEACWAYPIRRSGRNTADGVMVFWRCEPGLPEPSATMMAERLVRLCELVLERVEHHRELQHSASHDALTGLVNRSHFFATVDGHLARSTTSLGVLYLDLDGFKPINDQWGHGYGDQVLQVVADRLRASVRPTDTVGRLGGDEFAVACPGADTDELIRLADRLLAVVRAPITVRGEVLRVGTSIGMASCEPGSAVGQGEVLVAEADGALISAKATAKGSWKLSGDGV
ncbi:diguanylate cyclase domain-containing protein [Aquihabitans sp. McL0605]|uniref:sensor domain-containing protein n=1 Tax=Aquihabitans sp. McL0605 TaxID=3415671 RepID=UPI003CE8D18A